MDELYIDINKAFQGGGGMHRLNTAKLIRRMVQVRGKNGKIFTRMQWVRPWEASTGHGVRAIHNQNDYNQAKEHGVFEHPDAHNALAHQGIHNAEHFMQGMHHEHPVFLPETEQSAHAAMKHYVTNHIPQGYDQYTRHEHTNGIHYSHNDEDVMPWDDDAVPQDYKPDKDEDSDDEHLHPVNGLQQMESKPKDESIQLPEDWNGKASFELSKYAKEHYPNRYGEFVDALEMAKREQNGGDLGSYDELVLEMVRENLRLPAVPYSGDANNTASGGLTRDDVPQWVWHASPDSLWEGFENTPGSEQRELYNLSRVAHRDNPDYKETLRDMAEYVGDSRDSAHNEPVDDLTPQERKVKRMTKQRVPSQAKPKSKSIGELTKPLDIDQIRMEHPGIDLEDFYKGDHNLDSDDETALRDLFNGMPVSALEHIFSHPSGDYTMKIVGVDVPRLGRAKLGMNIYSANEGYIGGCTRSVHRLPDGTYHVHNDILSISRGKDKGMATHLYHRSEQLWKYLAGEGNKVEISVFANISVGTYAWAGKEKGFDFDDTSGRNSKRDELREFIKLNDWKEDEVMKSCGYTSVDDLNHAWQFAELDDGYTYDLTPHGFEDATGEVHLGKAFMLTHASSWTGMKYINDDGSVNRQKHIDRLVGEHQDDMGEWYYDDEED